MIEEKQWRVAGAEIVQSDPQAHLAEPADTQAARGRKRHAKTDRSDSRLLRGLLADGRLPESWIAPTVVLEWRERVRLYKTLVDQRSTWVQRVHAELFQRGVTVPESAIRWGGTRQLLEDDQLEISPAGRQRILTAYRMIDAINDTPTFNLNGVFPLSALATVPLLTLAVFFALPVGGMLARGLWVDGAFDPVGVLEVLGRSRVHRVLWFTVWSAGLATLVTLLLGLPVTFALYRLRLPGRRALRAFLVMPFVLPTVVVGVAFRTLLAPSGPLGFLGLDGTALAILAFAFARFRFTTGSGKARKKAAIAATACMGPRNR